MIRSDPSSIELKVEKDGFFVEAFVDCGSDSEVEGGGGRLAENGSESSSDGGSCHF